MAAQVRYSGTMRTKGSASRLLGRAIAPLGRCLTPAAAKEIVSLRSDPAARRRVEKLPAKCDAGALTPEQRAEYALFVEVGDMVALLQAKARHYLAQRRAAWARRDSGGWFDTALTRAVQMNSDKRLDLRAKLLALGGRSDG